MQSVVRHSIFKGYFDDADYSDVKQITADVTLREFIAGMLAYQPWWLAMLYRLREVLVAVLGLVRNEPSALPTVLPPADIPFGPDGKVAFFTVERAEEKRFWIARTPPDKHLSAHLGIVNRPTARGRNQFTVFTTVRFLHWTGPVYFTLIRPFHHLVVGRMMKAGARFGTRTPAVSAARRSGAALIDRFSIQERILLPIGWYGFMLVGTWGVLRQSAGWAAGYLLYAALAFGLLILPGLCAHCPYPSRYGTCLFLPPAFLNRFYPYRGPTMSPAEKRAVPAAMAGIVLIPQFWLIREPTLLLLFWLLALPTLAAFPRHYCRHCRHVGCPLNAARPDAADSI